MRTLCVILLMGILAYVQADEECYSFATGVEEANAGPYTENFPNNRILKLKDFLEREKTIFYTAWATPSKMPEAAQNCSAVTYGDRCGGVQYFMEFKDGHNKITDNLLQDIQFDMTIISYNSGTYDGIEYKMTVRGISKNKYIFQWVEDTPIIAEVIKGTGSQKNSLIDLPLEVKNALKSKFALYGTMPNGYSLFVTCDGKTHGDDCGGVEYTRKTKDGFNEITDDYFQGIQFETTFIGYNMKDGTSILFENTVRGIDKDDYIFKVDENTEIQAYELVDNNPAKKRKVDIPSNILNVLNSEFALYSFKPGSYSLFVKCTGEYAWVTYPINNPTSDAVDDDLQRDIAQLTEIVQAKKHIQLEIHPINKTFPENLTAYLKELTSKELPKFYE